MHPTIVRLSKASRRPLTPKRGNKDYYKGTRQAYLPGGLRTGAPGKHVVSGKAKYRLIDEQVRVFVAPPIQDILSSPLKPYVSVGVNLKPAESQAVWGRFTDSRGLSAEHFLQVARERTAGEIRATEEASKPTLSWPKRVVSTNDTTVPAESPAKTVLTEEVVTEAPSTSSTSGGKVA
ncbi:hypothetical protein H0H92_006494 [Tricholoma furcatifolium]|nr:hypothetical protein H0H92_006494 [Tricholoma furcatifolium]